MTEDKIGIAAVFAHHIVEGTATPEMERQLLDWLSRRQPVAAGHDLEKRLREWSRMMRAADLPKPSDDHRVADPLQEAAEALAGPPEREGWVLVPGALLSDVLSDARANNEAAQRECSCSAEEDAEFAAERVEIAKLAALLSAAPKPEAAG